MVRDALVELPYGIVAAVLVGGTEKLRGGEQYGVPLVDSLEEAIASFEPDVVLDLSDEPVLGPAARFRLAARSARARGAVRGRRLPSRSAALRADRDALGRRDRDGEARRQDRRHRARGAAARPRAAASSSSRWGVAGRPSPSSSSVRPTSPICSPLSGGTSRRVRSSRDRRGDGLQTVGCRRCGGGLAGAVGISNVVAGVRLAEGLDARPAAARRQRCGDPADRGRPPHPRRRRPSGPGGCDRVSQPLPGAARRPGRRHDGGGRAAHAGLCRRARRLARPGVPGHPGRRCGHGRSTTCAAERVAYFGTAPAAQHDRIAAHLERRLRRATSSTSRAASATAAALRAELAHLDADVFVVEIKAAAIDVVAEEAQRRGARSCSPRTTSCRSPGEPDLDVELERLAAEAIAAAAVGV